MATRALKKPVLVGLGVLAAGAAFLSSRTAKASSKEPEIIPPGGVTDEDEPLPPGGVTDKPTFPPPPHDLPVRALFTVRKDDIPIGVAIYYGGSLKQIEAENPGLHLGTVETQMATGWVPGSEIILPGSFRAFRKELPTTGSFNPIELTGSGFPEPLPTEGVFEP